MRMSIRWLQTVLCTRTLLATFLLTSATCWMLVGCGDNIRPPTAAQLARFEPDAPTGPTVDVTEIVEAKIPTGPYRVVPDDVLQLEVAMVLDPPPIADIAPRTTTKQTYTCRVANDGTIALPVVERIAVEGKTLAAIESAVVAAYYPKYVKKPVPVYANVVEYKTCRVSIVGAVATPGIYNLRHDQMSLVALLMEAGNIVDDGAALIRISQGKPNDPSIRVPLLRPTGSVARMSPVSEDPARLVFEREGPLGTTGWLAIEGSEGRPLRQWLDLANEAQRRTFVQTAKDLPQVDTGANLEARLVHLAGYLEADSKGRSPDSTPMTNGWRTAEQSCFVASLQQRTGNGTAPDDAQAGATNHETSTNILLPVKGLNVPFADVALCEGASVTVGRPLEQSIVIVGLVNRPGLMPYPLDARYTLVEAIAFAGGLNLVADPRYVSIYRLKSNGTVGGVTVQLVNPKKKQELTQAMSMVLHPGDVVSVEHTMRTRTNVFLDRVFRISLGLYFNPESLWND